MTKMSHLVRPCRQFMLLAGVTLAIAAGAFAQTTTSGSSTTTDDGGYAKWEITPFFGGQWYQAFQEHTTSNYTSRFQSGWIFGERFSGDLNSHVALEGQLQLGHDPLILRPNAPAGLTSLSTFNTEFALDLVFHFQPNTAKTRWFILTGPAGILYTPRNPSNESNPAAVFSQPPERKLEPGLLFGFGVKHYFNGRYGVRYDLTERVGPASHFGLPQNSTVPNTVFIPAGGTNSTLMFSVGLILREGYVSPAPAMAPVMSQALRVDLASGPTGSPTITGAHDVCAGDDLRLSVNANGFPSPTYAWRVNGTAAAGASGATFAAPTATGTGARAVTVVVSGAPTVGTSAPFSTMAGTSYHLTAEPQGLGGRSASYQWMLNGQPISGATSASYDMPSGGGPVTVQVTAQNAPVTSSPANFTINALTPPTLTFAVTPATVPYTSAAIPLRAVATASSCGGAVTVTYSGEAVTGTNFNPGSVSGFDMGNRVRPQTKTVTITATARDTKGQTVTRTAPVTVTLDPEARRLPDVVFPNLSARVNNCGKRLLLEELTPLLRNDPGAKVILIGHRDEKEKGSKAALELDTTRVLNAAAVLSAGKGICPQLDLSRIMMKAVGTDQSATPRPGLCGASTNVKEKSGQAVKESDKNAEYRRVEVWIVPSGAAMPAGLTGLTPVPAPAVTKLGCPK